MSYQEKYLKYKAKYITLKSKQAQAQKELQLGGSNISKINNLNNIKLQLGGNLDKQIFDINNLSDTPTVTNLLGITTHTKSQTGGNSSKIQNQEKSFKIINNLTETPTLNDIWSGNYKVNQLRNLLSNSLSVNNPNYEHIGGVGDGEDDGYGEGDGEGDGDSNGVGDGDSNGEGVVGDGNGVGGGLKKKGKKSKPNSYKKFFFDESDIFSSSVTSDSDLSSFTSSLNSSDSDL